MTEYEVYNENGRGETSAHWYDKVDAKEPRKGGCLESLVYLAVLGAGAVGAYHAYHYVVDKFFN